MQEQSDTHTSAIYYQSCDNVSSILLHLHNWYNNIIIHISVRFSAAKVHPNQQYANESIICHDCHKIVHCRDQRTGSNRRIDFDLVEEHRDDRADQTRNDHRQKQLRCILQQLHAYP